MKIRRSLVTLFVLGAFSSLAACTGTSNSVPAPASPSVAGTTSMQESSATASPSSPQESAATSQSPDASPSAATEPEDSAPAAGVPSALQGRWIFLGDSEQVPECEQVEEGEGTILEVTATTISSFASLSELVSVETSDAVSMEGTFSYQDDSDDLITSQVRLETTDEGQTLTYTELGENTGVAPARYGRCS
ncbi:MAG: hypothetical protein ACTHU1_03365 [Arachnia sp.]